MSGPVPGYGQANWSANEGRRLQRHGSHMCAFPRGQEKKGKNGPSGSAGTPAATAHWDDSERARSLARSCSRARSSAASLAPSAVSDGHREGPGGRIGGQSSGSPQIVQSSSSSIARRSTLRLAAPGNARLPGRLPGSDGRRLQKPRDARRTGGGNFGADNFGIHSQHDRQTDNQTKGSRLAKSKQLFCLLDAHNH